MSAVMATCAIAGGAAAIVTTPVPSSSAASHVATTTVARDVVTPEVQYLAAQAQSLGSEIANAQAQLSHLQEQVAYEASLSHFHLSVPVISHPPATTTNVATQPRKTTPTTVSPSTTSTSTTTTASPTTRSRHCDRNQGNDGSPPNSTCARGNDDN